MAVEHKDVHPPHYLRHAVWVRFAHRPEIACLLDPNVRKLRIQHFDGQSGTLDIRV
eukprot:CAMPEP_0197529808 /NCGR_PEP_ID=MMETSP1318-20131121/29762_1 /TAXON_ID=552666 /ORGANISM="Partenskyella glossopodia, Strain RCC365" /LENGTH=55 /DNA_ID=CAMNT_0043085411 /DNA_START=86 /DNA_END=250 /DNA_ORIENTATION=+